MTSVTYTYRPSTYGPSTYTYGPSTRWEGEVVALVDGAGVVGHLRWFSGDHSSQPYEIAGIRVEEGYRRQGIATQLLREAQKIEPNVRHSKVRTTPGDLWAKSTGDTVPIRGGEVGPCACGCGRIMPRDFSSFVDDIRHKILNEAEL